MKKLFFFSLLCCITIAATAQPAIQWQRSYGGRGHEFGTDMQQTPDGGYILTGYATSDDGDLPGHNGHSVWVVKLSATGSIQWQKTFGGSGYDYPNAIIAIPGGGYVVAGYSSSTDGDVTGNHGYNDYWIVKLSDTGSIVWQKSLGGSVGDEASSIHQTSDGGYIVAGKSESHDGDATANHGMYDFWVVKLSSTGNIQWQRSYGGSGPDEAKSVQQTSDGGYIVAGWTNSTDGDVTITAHTSSSSPDCWIIKLSPVGDIIWKKTYGGNYGSSANSIQQTTDGGYIVAGLTGAQNGDATGNHGSNDFWVVKLLPSGSIQWQKCFGGSYYDVASSVQQTTDDGYIVAGITGCIDGDVTGKHDGYDYWLVKISSSGILQWQKTLGGDADENAYAARQTSDGGYVVTGRSASNNGDVSGNHGMTDFWVVKLAAVTDVPDVSTSQEITVVPNPTTGDVFVKGIDKCTISIYNSIGQLVKEVTNGTEFSLSEVPAGLYIARVYGQNGLLVHVARVVKE